MNMQVNLILDTEKRSGSTVSLKFVVRAALVAVPVLLGILVAGLFMMGHSARQGLRYAEQEKKQQEPVYQTVLGLDRKLKEYQQVADVLDGWGNSRTDWRSVLHQLQAVVPPSIQLLKVTVNENLERVDNLPARVSGIYIRGKVVGDHAEEAVQALDRALKSRPAFTNAFGPGAPVEVKRFEASDNVAEKNTRVFDIECILIPKKIGKPKGKR